MDAGSDLLIVIQCRNRGFQQGIYLRARPNLSATGNDKCEYEQCREQKGRVNLDDPAVTLALIKLNAVVGVTGQFNQSGTLKSVGIQCALCHSTVDNSIPALCDRQQSRQCHTDLVGGTASTDSGPKRLALSRWEQGNYVIDGDGRRGGCR